MFAKFAKDIYCASNKGDPSHGGASLGLCLGDVLFLANDARMIRI